MKATEKKKEKPKYSVRQKPMFLVKKAWRLEKRIVLLPVLLECIRLLQQLTELFIAPMILSTLETETEFSVLLLEKIRRTGRLHCLRRQVQ